MNEAPNMVAPAPAQPAGHSGSHMLWGVVLFILGLLIGVALGWSYGPTAEAPEAMESSSPSPSPSADTGNILFESSKYDISFELPASWRGIPYMVAVAPNRLDDGEAGISPILYVREYDPITNESSFWTPFTVSVQTLAQWEFYSGQEGPKPAKELGRSAAYVFSITPPGHEIPASVVASDIPDDYSYGYDLVRDTFELLK